MSARLRTALLVNFSAFGLVASRPVHSRLLSSRVGVFLWDMPLSLVMYVARLKSEIIADAGGVRELTSAMISITSGTDEEHPTT